MSYTYPIGGTPTQPAYVTSSALTIAANTQLEWATSYADTTLVAAAFMDITASAGGLAVLMPPGNEAANGVAVIFYNAGANSFEVQKSTGAAIVTIAAGESVLVRLTDNSTAAGTWNALMFGVGSASISAAGIAGAGLEASSNLLRLNTLPTFSSGSYTVTGGDRGTALIHTGGAVTYILTAAATLGAGFITFIRNEGSGAITIDPSGAETINGEATIDLAPNDSCILACTNNATSHFITVGLGKDVTFAFTRLTRSVAGSSDVTLSSSELANKIMNFSGILTGNINVIFAATPGVYYVTNSTTGAFTLTCKTASGTGIAIPQTQSRILTCDGTNMILSQDSGSGTVTSITAGTGLTGGTITASGTINLANTAVSAGTYGGTANVPQITVDAQGRLTAASNPSYAGQSSITTLGTITTGVWNGTTLALANGGTGQTSAQAAMNALAGGVTANRLLRGNGTNVVLAQADLTTDVTGTLPAANGGTGITSLGAGVADFLGTPSSANLRTAVSDETGTGSLVFATSPTLVTPALGTPSSGTLTNCTGLPISTGVAGLGTGVATFLGTPSSANLAAAVTGETGSGALVFATSPTLVTPALGTPSSGTLTSCTGLPISTGVSGLGANVATFLGTPSSANLRAALTDETGTGAAVFGTSPTIASPTLSGTITLDTGTYTGIATQAEMETATSTTTLVTPGRVINHPCIPKAWAYINASGTLLASYGVSSVTLTTNGGQDVYQINWTTAFSSANYCVIATADDTTVGGTHAFTSMRAQATNQTTTSTLIRVLNPTGGSTNTATLNVVAFGDQ